MTRLIFQQVLFVGQVIRNSLKELRSLLGNLCLITGEITFANWKTPLRGQEYYIHADISKDIFSNLLNRQWASAADKFFDNRLDDTITHLSFETNPQFQVKFDRLSSAGYGGYNPNDLDKFVVSYRNLEIGIRENILMT